MVELKADIEDLELALVGGFNRSMVELKADPSQASLPLVFRFQSIYGRIERLLPRSGDMTDQTFQFW